MPQGEGTIRELGMGGKVPETGTGVWIWQCRERANSALRPGSVCVCVSRSLFQHCSPLPLPPYVRTGQGPAHHCSTPTQRPPFPPSYLLGQEQGPAHPGGQAQGTPGAIAQTGVGGGGGGDAE